MLTGKNSQLASALPPDQRKAKGSFVRAVGSFVPKLTTKVFEKYGFHSAEIMTNWAQVAGADVAAWSEPERIRWPRSPNVETEDNATGRQGATLVIRVEPARALDIEYRGAEIIERINRYFGYRAVETLRIVQAPLTRKADTAKPNRNLAGQPIAASPAPMPVKTGGPEPEPAIQAALTALWASVSGAKSNR